MPENGRKYEHIKKQSILDLPAILKLFTPHVFRKIDTLFIRCILICDVLILLRTLAQQLSLIQRTNCNCIVTSESYNVDSFDGNSSGNIYKSKSNDCAVVRVLQLPVSLA